MKPEVVRAAGITIATVAAGLTSAFMKLGLFGGIMVTIGTGAIAWLILVRLAPSTARPSVDVRGGRGGPSGGGDGGQGGRIFSNLNVQGRLQARGGDGGEGVGAGRGGDGGTIIALDARKMDPGSLDKIAAMGMRLAKRPPKSENKETSENVEKSEEERKD